VKKIIVIILLFIFSFAAAGCWDQKIYERIGFDLQVGVELSSDGSLLTTRAMPVIGKGTTTDMDIIKTKGSLIRETRNKTRLKSPKEAEGGKVQQVLVSKSIAEKGIHELLEVYEREFINPVLAYVVIVDGSPYELIEASHKFIDKPIPPFYINELLKNGIKSGAVPECRIYDYDIKYYTPGIDPMLPIIKISSEGKEIEVSGSALFSKDKMVGKVTTVETSLIRLMGKKLKNGGIIFYTEGDGENLRKGAAVSYELISHKIKVHIDNNRPIVNIKFDLDCVLDEYKWGSIENPEDKERYEKIFTKELKEKCIKVLKYTQEVNSDPIGIGDIVRAKENRYWKTVDWNKTYKEVQFNIEPSLKIIRSGVIK